MASQLSISARPVSLDGLIGQEKTVASIRGQMKSGRVQKAWMFCGPKGCITGDSLLDIPRDFRKYPDGVPIEKLVGMAPWVYAYDLKKNRIVCTKSAGVFEMGTKDVYRLTFRYRVRDGHKGIKECIGTIDTTGDHRFLLRQREATKALKIGVVRKVTGYKRMDQLVAGDRLMPLLRSWEHDAYALLYLNDGTRVREHRFIAAAVYEERGDDWHCHHVDECTLNNRPTNLEWLMKKEHHALHGSTRPPTYIEHPRGMAGKRQTKHQRKIASRVNSKRWDQWRTKQKDWHNPAILNKLIVQQGLTAKEIAARYGVRTYRIKNALRAHGIDEMQNHEVVAIEYIGKRRTYDVVVPNYHNFVANGVVVHNSGKTTAARIVALSYQCTHQKVFGSPCKECRRLRTSFTIVEHPCAMLSGVKEVKAALQGVEYGPMGAGKYRIYIMDEFHRASEQAQSLFLSPLEDSPETTIFIFCTTEAHNVLETIQSRCAVYELRELSLDDIEKLVAKLLSKVGSDLPADRLTASLVERRIHSPRYIAQAVEKYVGGADPDDAAKVEGNAAVDVKGLTRAVIKGDWPGVTQQLAAAQSMNIRGIQASLIAYLRTILLETEDISDRQKTVSEAIITLAGIGNTSELILSATVAATLYRVTSFFAKYKG